MTGWEEEQEEAGEKKRKRTEAAENGKRTVL